MSLDEKLLKKLNQHYEANTMVKSKHRGKDIAFKTDAEGNAIQLFIGRLTSNGNIQGQRYARLLVKDKNGITIKDHWDLKGKSS